MQHVTCTRTRTCNTHMQHAHAHAHAHATRTRTRHTHMAPATSQTERNTARAHMHPAPGRVVLGGCCGGRHGVQAGKNVGLHFCHNLQVLGPAQSMKKHSTALYSRPTPTLPTPHQMGSALQGDKAPTQPLPRQPSAQGCVPTHQFGCPKQPVSLRLGIRKSSMNTLLSLVDTVACRVRGRVAQGDKTAMWPHSTASRRPSRHAT